MNIQTFPNSPYRLRQPFEPAGDQPTAIAQLVEGIEDGLAFQTLLGVTGSPRFFCLLVMLVLPDNATVVAHPGVRAVATIKIRKILYPPGSDPAGLFYFSRHAGKIRPDLIESQ